MTQKSIKKMESSTILMIKKNKNSKLIKIINITSRIIFIMNQRDQSKIIKTINSISTTQISKIIIMITNIRINITLNTKRSKNQKEFSIFKTKINIQNNPPRNLLSQTIISINSHFNNNLSNKGSLLQQMMINILIKKINKLTKIMSNWRKMKITLNKSILMK